MSGRNEEHLRQELMEAKQEIYRLKQENLALRTGRNVDGPIGSGKKLSRRDLIKGVFGVVATAGAYKLGLWQGQASGEENTSPESDFGMEPQTVATENPTQTPIPTEHPTTEPTQTPTEEPIDEVQVQQGLETIKRPTPEWLRESKLTIGMNTHPANVEEAAWDADQLARMGIRMNRFNFNEDELAFWDGNAVRMKEDGLSKYEQIIEENTSRGIDVFMVSSIPYGISKDLSPEEQIIASGQYFGSVAERFKGKVKVWQIANEPNVHNYVVNYGDSSYRFTDEVAEHYGQFVAAGAEAIRAADPDSAVTVNMSFWYGRGRETNLEEARRMLEVTKEHIDAFTIDFYPDTAEQARDLAEIIQLLQDEYQNIPIIVGEIGLPVSNQESSVDRFNNVVMPALDNLAGSQARAVIFYELKDPQGTDPFRGEAFGLLAGDGTPKQVFADTLNRLRDMDSDTDQEVDPEATPLG